MKKLISDYKIAFGTYQIFDQAKMTQAIRAALENNYPIIDSAKLYNNEKQLAKALKIMRQEKRKMPLLQSKIWPSDFPKGALAMIKRALKIFDMEKIDVFLIHRPDVNMSQNVAIWKELIAAQKANLVTYIGVSNFDRDQIEVLYNETGVYPEINQIEASITYLRQDRIFYNRQKGIILQGWRPFGRYQSLKDNQLLKKLAQKYHCSVAQIFVAYITSMGIISVVSSQKPEEIKENKLASEIKMAKSDIVLIENSLNSHQTTTHNGSDSFANLALDLNWYKNN